MLSRRLTTSRNYTLNAKDIAVPNVDTPSRQATDVNNQSYNVANAHSLPTSHRGTVMGNDTATYGNHILTSDDMTLPKLRSGT